MTAIVRGQDTDEPEAAAELRKRMGLSDEDVFPPPGVVGSRRNLVEVTYGGQVFYLDDEPYGSDQRIEIPPLRPGMPNVQFNLSAGYHGWGWAKVTEGRGSPSLGHRSVRVVEGTVEPRD